MYKQKSKIQITPFNTVYSPYMVINYHICLVFSLVRHTKNWAKTTSTFRSRSSPSLFKRPTTGARMRARWRSKHCSTYFRRGNENWNASHVLWRLTKMATTTTTTSDCMRVTKRHVALVTSCAYAMRSTVRVVINWKAMTLNMYACIWLYVLRVRVSWMACKCAHYPRVVRRLHTARCAPVRFYVFGTHRNVVSHPDNDDTARHACRIADIRWACRMRIHISLRCERVSRAAWMLKRTHARPARNAKGIFKWVVIVGTHGIWGGGLHMVLMMFTSDQKSRLIESLPLADLHYMFETWRVRWCNVGG